MPRKRKTGEPWNTGEGISRKPLSAASLRLIWGTLPKDAQEALSAAPDRKREAEISLRRITLGLRSRHPIETGKPAVANQRADLEAIEAAAVKITEAASTLKAIAGNGLFEKFGKAAQIVIEGGTARRAGQPDRTLSPGEVRATLGDIKAAQEIFGRAAREAYGEQRWHNVLAQLSAIDGEVKALRQAAVDAREELPPSSPGTPISETLLETVRTLRGFWIKFCTPLRSPADKAVFAEFAKIAMYEIGEISEAETASALRHTAGEVIEPNGKPFAYGAVRFTGRR
jgi:hypothetical protein